MSPSRGSHGFTVLELLMALFILASTMASVMVAFSWSVRESEEAVNHLPLAIANANLEQILRPAVEGAVCVKSPASGSAADALLLYPTADCSGNALLPPLAGGEGYYAFCLVGEVLLFVKGSGTPTTSDCSEETVYALNPVGVKAAAGSSGNVFRLETSRPNVVNVDLHLFAGALQTHATWQAAIATQTPLEAP